MSGRINRISIEHVQYMPKELRPGVLYVSREFHTAAHLCACGCGSKVRTPIKPTEWSLKEPPTGPSLWPSVGNWQRPCKSHYIIDKGNIVWCGQWTSEQIASGQNFEQIRREAHYAARTESFVAKIWRKFLSLFE